MEQAYKDRLAAARKPRMVRKKLQFPAEMAERVAAERRLYATRISEPAVFRQLVDEALTFRESLRRRAERERWGQERKT